MYHSTGLSEIRPEALRRKRKLDEEERNKGESVQAKKRKAGSLTKPTIDAGGTSIHSGHSLAGCLCGAEL